MNRLDREYFSKNAVQIAQDLLGKTLVRKFDDGSVLRAPIVETEAYFGFEDRANHASKGRTPRTEIMFARGGVIYVYLIYGVHWLLNIVTGSEGHPEAVLIRGVYGISGPGRIGKRLKLDRSFYGENIENSHRIWIEDTMINGKISASPRIGIAYAGTPWKDKLWRFELKPIN